MHGEKLIQRFHTGYSVNKFNHERLKTPCWEWIKYKDKDGYGVTSIQSYPIQAHRLSYEIKSGSKIPKGMVVRHRCDNTSCVNPEHLKIGTHKQNRLDCIKRKRNNPRKAKGTDNSNCKLTEDQVIDIFIRTHAGELHKNIAKEYNVGKNVPSQIKRGVSWSHVTKSIQL